MEFIAPSNADGAMVSVALDIDGTGDQYDFTELDFNLDGVKDFGAWPVSWGMVLSESAYAAVADSIHKDFLERQWGQICPFDKSLSGPKARRIDRPGQWYRVVTLARSPLL